MSIDKTYRQITGIDATTPVSIGVIPVGTSAVTIVAEGAAIRFRSDGTNPSATVGNPVANGGTVKYDLGSIGQLMFIAQSGTAIVNLQFEGL
jgi:hypothetical protein